MFKWLGIASLLSAFIITNGAHASDLVTKSAPSDFKAAPTPLNMMALMSTYLSSEVSPQQLLDMGVEANMRVPMEHLHVRFTDLRTELEISREEIAHILGQSRQESTRDLIMRAMSAFSVAGTAHNQLIDLFDAAALASMQSPPDYVNIEFYDARLGAAGSHYGGISGSVLDKIYSPSHSSVNVEVSDNVWDDLAIVDFFVANDRVFEVKDDYEFALPYSTVVKDLKSLSQIARKDLELFLESEPGLDVRFANSNAPFFTHATVATQKDMRKYIGLLHLKAGNKGKTDEMRKMYTKIYGK